MDKVNKALELFNQGCNCAQAVFSVYSNELGIEKETALKTAHGFGAGMGRLQEVCGAVTGAYMVLGLKYGSAAANDTAAKEKLYGLIREFAQKFDERNKATICRDLLGVDLINGDKKINAARVKAVCPKAVKDAVEILEELSVERKTL